MAHSTEFYVVLDYWFEGEPLGELQVSRWWKKNKAIDDEIRTEFAELVDQVYNSLSGEWAATAKGRLAAIICLDQFPRNMYRESPRSFQYDEKALSLCKEGLRLNQYSDLEPLKQTFLVMPLMHSENLADQELCIKEFERLVSETSGAIQKYLKGSLSFAVSHRDIIAQFQRFPHRNKILGRQSTGEEVLFLQQPGSSF